jgi:T5SS/PEP-CTERM-associated repeat protein
MLPDAEIQQLMNWRQPVISTCIGRIGWFALAASALTQCAVAVPVTSSWDTNSSGNFNDAANWDIRVPVSGDTAQFNRGAAATYAVTFPGDLIFNPTRTYTNDRLYVGSNTVTFAKSASHQLGPAKYALSSGTSAEGGARGIIVGDGPADTVAVLQTSLVSLSAVAATIGNQFGSVGTLVVDGGVVNITGSDSSDTDLYVGDHGTGYLYIQNSGQVNLTGDQGNVSIGHTKASSIYISGSGSLLNVQGANSKLDVVQGSLSITMGAQLNTSGAASVSPAAVVTVDGAGSTWSASGTGIDLDTSGGAGMLNVTGGGTGKKRWGNPDRRRRIELERFHVYKRLFLRVWPQRHHADSRRPPCQRKHHYRRLRSFRKQRQH